MSQEDHNAKSVQALFQAAREYHQKHSRGPGGARVCVCGMGCGGSAACSGLALVRDLFRYADFDNPEWRKHFESVATLFGG